jgi:hypothetical protein
MFDPSKLDLNLDENKDKKDAPVIKKTESEKFEEHTQEPSSTSQSTHINSSSQDDLEGLLNTPENLDSEQNITTEESPELTTIDTNVKL